MPLPPVDTSGDVLFSAPAKLHGERNEASVLFDAEAMGAPPRRGTRPLSSAEHSAMIDLDALPRPPALRRPAIGSYAGTTSAAHTSLPAPRVVPGGTPLRAPGRQSRHGSPSRAIAVAGALGFIGVALVAALLLPV